MSDMRSKFEEWAKDSYALMRDSTGEYLDADSYNTWAAFQAGVASVQNEIDKLRCDIETAKRVGSRMISEAIDAGIAEGMALPQGEQCPSASFTKASWDAFEYWMERDIGNENVSDPLKDAWNELTPQLKEQNENSNV